MTADERQIVREARDQHTREERRKSEPPPAPARVVDVERGRRVRQQNRSMIADLTASALEWSAEAALAERLALRKRTAVVQVEETVEYGRIRAACAAASASIDLDAHAALVTAVVLRAKGALA